MRQYILVRTDKKYPIGKIMAHVGHNCTLVALNISVKKDERVFEWMNEPHFQRKVVVKGGSEKNIQIIVDQAEREDIYCSFIKDTIYKQRICAVIGPVTDEESYHLGLADLPLYRVDKQNAKL